MMNFINLGRTYYPVERTSCYLLNKKSSIQVRLNDLPKDIRNNVIFFNVIIHTNFNKKCDVNYFVTELSKELGVRKNCFKLKKGNRYCTYKIIYSCPTTNDLDKFVEVLKPTEFEYESFKTYDLFNVVKLFPTKEAVLKYKLKCELAGLWNYSYNYAYSIDGYDGCFVDTGKTAVEINGNFYNCNVGYKTFWLGDIIE